jgi:long-chain acyl-CoA synthetase
MPAESFPWEHSYPPGVSWHINPIPGTIVAVVEAAFGAHAGSPAIDFRGAKFSYAELSRAVDGVAARLLMRRSELANGIALYLPNVPDHPICFLASLKCASYVVHLSPLDAERTLIHKLRDSGARTLVTTNLAPLLPMALKLLDRGLVDTLYVCDDARWGSGALQPLAIPVDHPGVVPMRPAAAPPSWPVVAPSDIALLQYTGGTTGLPRAAILTHANLTCTLQIYQEWYGGQGVVSPGQERIICVLPLFHIYALTTILLRQLSNGNEILLRQRFDVETTLSDIEHQRATAFAGVPTMWIALANHPGVDTHDFSSLKVCASGGAPLPIEVQQRFERLTGQRLGGGWGMTETCPAGTLIPIQAATKPGTVGLPVPGVEIDIAALDDPRRAVGTLETGEIRIKGPNVTRGYWGQPEESASAFVDGWFLTGDVGYMDADGFVFLVDRKKDLIISGGFNVYPQAIEQAVYEHPSVEEAVAIGIADPYRGEAVKVFVTLRVGASAFTLDALRIFLADKLGRHELPTALEIRDSLPRTPVGKLSRLELRNQERSPLS